MSQKLPVNGFKPIYDHADGIRDPLKQDLTPDFCRNQEKVISILTETHINHDPIQPKRNN